MISSILAAVGGAVADQNASGGGAPRLTEGSDRFPRAMLKVRGASASNRPRSPAPTACSSRDAVARRQNAASLMLSLSAPWSRRGSSSSTSHSACVRSTPSCTPRPDDAVRAAARSFVWRNLATTMLEQWNKLDHTTRVMSSYCSGHITWPSQGSRAPKNEG